jgi:hypothetical protein
MAKKAKARPPQAAPPTKDAAADANFVKVVAAIYHCIIDDTAMVPEWKLLSGDDQLAAREVGAGLVAIHRALEKYPPEGIEGDNVWIEPRSCAYKLLRALVDRTSGPAWRYVSNISLSRIGRPPVDDSVFVGIVFALQEAAKRDGKRLSRKAAVTVAKAECPQFSDTSYTDQAIKGWITRGKVPDADDYRRHIIRQVEDMSDDRSFTSRVIEVARQSYRLILFKLD